MPHEGRTQAGQRPRPWRTGGLDVADVRTLLAGDAYADRVRADERRAVECGVTGVPSLVIDGRPPVSGVQAADGLRRLLSRRPAVPVE
ncbi:DsbA family protein [Micromonospora echinofusca]|uniref:DsbA family oxidoreductase n=1 Tax=Micromonospora echinofusca TaxID=47858 RepID=UPI000C7122FE|nr:DsbA family protein [Micromonospora sp. MSM11]